MNQDEFLYTYFKLLSERFMKLGYEKDYFIKAVMAGTQMMILNDGKVSNEKRFWETFSKLITKDLDIVEKEFIEFYQHDFDKVKVVTKANSYAKLCIDMLKEKGYKLVLTTNPLFPKIATYKRIQWAGLNPEDFMLVTTYENSFYSKPNPKYYLDVLRIINKTPQECIMVGNDVTEDMGVSALNINTILLTDNLINKNNVDISIYNPHDFNKLFEFIKNLPNIR